MLIEHVDKIVGLRRNLVLEESRFPSELTTAFRSMENQGNPWGQPASARLDWTRSLEFEVPTVASMAAEGRLDELDVLYWVGCAAAFDTRNQKVARAVATCLHAAGVRFAVLGQEESCTGDPARRMGNDYVFQILASGNVETLDRYGMGERTIVTACPHCFNTIGNEYGQLGGSYKIVHHSTFLADLVSSGRLATVPEEAGSETGDHRPGSVTVHDSCYLARYNNIIAAPRDVLGAAGVSITEMEKSGKNTFCCGAGGGRMWMEETRGTRINENRTAQVLATGAETVATSCPFCMVMMSDGLAAAPGGTAVNADGHQRGPGGADRVGAGGAAAAGDLRGLARGPFAMTASCLHVSSDTIVRPIDARPGGLGWLYRLPPTTLSVRRPIAILRLSRRTQVASTDGSINRGAASVDHQPVIRMNRDTLYSFAIIDISVGCDFTLPDAGDRYLSVMVVNQDHYINEVLHEAGDHALTVDRFDTAVRRGRGADPGGSGRPDRRGGRQ